MKQAQIPPRRNVPPAKPDPSPKITGTVDEIAAAAVSEYKKTHESLVLDKTLGNMIAMDVARIAASAALDGHGKPSRKLKQVLTQIREAGQAKNISQSIQMNVASARRNEDPEREGFAQEMAMQYGFTPIDDDGEIYGVTAERLVDLMSVLGYRTSAEHEIKINLPGLIYKEDAERRAFRQGEFAEDTAAFRSATEVPAVATSGNALASVPVVPGYTILLGVLMEALNQAQYGKGADRHNLGGDIPFERQRMQQISELIGSPDGMVYQACKKITEGMELPTLDRQVAELLGAINYLAGIVIFLRKRGSEDAVAATLAKKSEIQARLLETMKASPDECAANGEGCSFGPHGPNGETQCRYCGEQQPLKPYVDPVMREYPKTPTTGWVANCVNDLFGTLDALAYELRDNPAVQRLARVWRKNSPILMAIDRHRDLIDNTIQSPDIDPAAAPWVDSDIDPNEAAENHLRKMGIPT